MTDLTLHLHGPLRITGPDGAPLTGLSRRGQAMLAYLARQPGCRAERGLVADLLWSDRSEDQARASLRQELSVLRRVMPEGVIDADRQAVWLDEARVLTATTGEGTFLQGFDLASEGFEDWLRAERSASSAPAVAPTPPKGQDRPPTLAVLPFEEFGADAGDMFADGVVEEITGALSRAHDVRVIARQSAFALRGAGLSVPQAAEKLGADYIVEGSVRRSGARVRISVQLIGTDGRALWSERFDDRLDDLFDLQDRIAAQVAGQISPNLRAAEIARARTRAPADRTAYELTLSALPHFWAHRPEENARAIALLAQALAHDPDYAPAMAFKAWCHAHNCCYLWVTDGTADRQEAKRLVARALPMAQNDPSTLTALSAASSLALNDFTQARHLAERALTIDPNHAWAWLRMGWTCIYIGEMDTGFDALDRYEQLSPLDPFHFNALFGRAAGLRAMGRYTESSELCEQGMREGTGVTWAYRMLFGSRWLAGEKDKAMEAARKWREAHPQITYDMARDMMPKWTHDPDYIAALEKLWSEI